MSGLALRPPYRLALDANVFIRLEEFQRERKASEGLLAIYVYFEFIKRYLSHHKDIIFFPTALYEFNRKRNVGSTREHWDVFNGMRTLFETTIELELLADRAVTFDEAQFYLGRIAKDIKRIHKTLETYETNDWTFDFVRPPGGFLGVRRSDLNIEVLPCSAANELFKPLGLDYFREDRARLFFCSHIENHLRGWPKNDKAVFAKHQESVQDCLRKVLYLSESGVLRGIGDLDLFIECNVVSQFSEQSNGRSASSTISVSLDEDLIVALNAFSSISTTSGPMIGGEANADDNSAKMKAYVRDMKRVREGAQREREIAEKLKSFWIEIENRFKVA